MVRNNSIQDGIPTAETINAMDVSKLKQEIIDRIQSTNDVDTLKELLATLKYISLPIVDDNFTAEQERLLNEVSAAMDKGEHFTDEEINRDEDEWLRQG